MRGVWGATSITLSVAAAILGCVPPVMTILRGYASRGDFNALSPWRPHLVIGAFALLGLAYLFAYRGARLAGRGPGGVHGRAALVAWSWRILGVAAALCVVFVFFPYYSGWVMRAMGRGPSSNRSLIQQSTVRVILTIEGMDCPVCAGGLQNNLRQIPGVRRAEVSFQDKQAILEYDPRAVELAKFAQVISQAGFKLVGTVAGRE